MRPFLKVCLANVLGNDPWCRLRDYPENHRYRHAALPQLHTQCSSYTRGLPKRVNTSNYELQQTWRRHGIAHTAKQNKKWFTDACVWYRQICCGWIVIMKTSLFQDDDDPQSCHDRRNVPQHFLLKWLFRFDRAILALKQLVHDLLESYEVLSICKYPFRYSEARRRDIRRKRPFPLLFKIKGLISIWLRL